MVPCANRRIPLMTDREELKGRDDKYRKDEPESGRPGSSPKEPGRQSNEPGRQGQGSGSEKYPNPNPSGQKGTGKSSETEEE
jgi:hypothetical protein